jgi:hypothetical protein
MKVILNVDLEGKEADAFIWTEDHEPPPVIRPKMRKIDSKEKEERRESDKGG